MPVKLPGKGLGLKQFFSGFCHWIKKQQQRMNYKPTLLLAISMLLDVYYVGHSVGMWVCGWVEGGPRAQMETVRPPLPAEEMSSRT